MRVWGEGEVRGHYRKVIQRSNTKDTHKRARTQSNQSAQLTLHSDSPEHHFLFTTVSLRDVHTSIGDPVLGAILRYCIRRIHV